MNDRLNSFDPPNDSPEPPDMRPIDMQYEEQATLHALGLSEAVNLKVGREGRYEIRGRVGSGGFGSVFKAWDSKLRRFDALKVVGSWAGRGEDYRRLLHEAHALAALENPRNVVQVHDAGEHSNGEPFIVMQYVDGENLREWQASGERRLDELLAVYQKAGSGLAFIHGHDILHRDFKPDNVLIRVSEDREPCVLVSDFGLARGRQLRRPSGGTKSTRAGTPAYMAPEQRAGGEIGPSADQYAFCVSLWEAVTGAVPRPEAGDPWPPRRPPELPRWLYRVLRRGLAEDPGARHASMNELLDRLVSGPRRRRTLAWSFVGIVAFGGAGLVADQLSPDPCERIDAELASVWDEDRKRALEGGLAGLEVDYADALAERSVATLERAAARWRSSRAQSCEAPPVDPGEAERLRRCHERWLDHFARRVDLLTALDVAAAERVDDFLAVIDTEDICGPDRPALDLEVERVLDLAEAQELLGRYDEADALILEAQARAEQASPCQAGASVPLELGAVSLRAGSIRAHQGRPEAALAAFDEAARHGVACADQLLVARARLRAAKVRARDFHEPADARRDLEDARFLLDAGVGEPSVVFESWYAAGLVAQAERRWAAARGHFEQARSVAETLHPLATVRALTALGASAQQAGDTAAAIAAYEDALRLLSEQLREQHPRVHELRALLAYNRGIVHAQRGRPEAATEALVLAATSPNPEIALRARTELLRLAPSLDQARALLVHVDARPEVAPLVRAEALYRVGWVFDLLDQAGGLEALSRALALWQLHDPGSKRRDSCALLLVSGELIAGRPEAARARALALMARHPPGELMHTFAANKLDEANARIQARTKKSR